jgi:hypothetical protein
MAEKTAASHINLITGHYMNNVSRASGNEHRVAREAYEDSWDRIFGKDKEPEYVSPCPFPGGCLTLAPMKDEQHDG